MILGTKQYVYFDSVEARPVLTTGHFYSRQCILCMVCCLVQMGASTVTPAASPMAKRARLTSEAHPLQPIVDFQLALASTHKASTPFVLAPPLALATGIAVMPPGYSWL